MKKLVFLFCVFYSICTIAQNGLKETTYQGYLTSDLIKLANPLGEKKVNDLIKSNDIPLLYDYLELSYVLLASTLRHTDEATFSKHIDGSVEIAEKILILDKDHAGATAILSGMYGLKIAYSPMKAMFYGPKNSRYSERSIKLDSSDHMVLLMYGISKYNTPAVFGGDINKAIEVFKKIINDCETQKNTAKQWKYLHALGWLGLAYEEQEKHQLAKSAYKKALLTESRFEWGVELFGGRP